MSTATKDPKRRVEIDRLEWFQKAVDRRLAEMSNLARKGQLRGRRLASLIGQVRTLGLLCETFASEAEASL